MTMALSNRQRWVIYSIAIALTLLAVRWAGSQGDAVSEPTVQVTERAKPPARQPQADATPTAVPDLQLDKLGPRGGERPAADPFRAKSWEDAERAERRAKAPPPPPPPPPQAPPLPYTYLGKLIEGKQTVVFLTRQDRNYIVRAGDTIEGTYSVEAISEEGMVLNYKPLNIQQTLPFLAPGTVPRPSVPPTPSARRPAEDEDED